MEISLRRGRFVWVYFNIGTYMHWKRIAFDFYVRLFKKVRGFGIERIVAEVEKKRNQNCFGTVLPKNPPERSRLSNGGMLV